MFRPVLIPFLILFALVEANNNTVAQKRLDELVQRVDHLVYATPDLDRGISEIEKLLGVRATLGGKHPGRGTKNAFIALGPNSFLEIVAPDPDQPPAKEPRPFFKGLTESRLVRWFINSRDIGRVRDEAVRKGVPYGEVKPGGRQRPDGVQVSWRFTDPAKPVADGVVPFIIDWGDSPHPSQSAAKGATLISFAQSIRIRVTQSACCERWG